MESIERNGLTVERCSECGGLFLDRGELERLLEAEAPAVNTGTTNYGSRSTGSASNPEPQQVLREVLELARQYKGRGQRRW